ncbi:LexA/Signal peptidase [Aureobasidium subglaciale]|nr:LexA/Signal peptidase [Aureobasidium subglaciale]KAI5219483.1 LexA/Signal peptidase [Aureobasidium subglaciale]KAI5223197.1 LexA/Signal peptidase [Aureobasidium subglaciale]KAI5259759.1 LexA/Signal peptidase [Aureobasidium subglaciale]
MPLPHWATSCIKGGLLGITSWVTLNDHILELVTIEGTSMHPTLSPAYNETGAKDTLLIKKWKPTKDLQRGDVVMLNLPHKPEKLGIKRVVALEGDWVEMDWKRRSRELGVEGKGAGMVWDAIGEEKEFGMGKRRWRVPLGHVWVEGDNASASKDSNTYGPVSKSLIAGKALYCLWPLDQFGEKPWAGYNIKTKVEKGPEMDVGEWENLYR